MQPDAKPHRQAYSVADLRESWALQCIGLQLVPNRLDSPYKRIAIMHEASGVLRSRDALPGDMKTLPAISIGAL